MECILCQQEINKKRDLWVSETHFDKEEKITEIFYHKKCHEGFHREKFQQEYSKRMKVITPLLKSLFGGKKEYEIA